MNSNLLELLQNSIELSTFENEYLIEYLESCLQHGTFYCQGNAETVIKTINSCLNSSFDKEKGLLLILAFLPQISVDTFSKKAISWMTHCNKIINQKEEGVSGLGLRVLAKLIKLSVKFPDVSKNTTKVVPKFLLDNVRRRTGNQFSLELLECLQAIMYEYSGPAGDFKDDILRLVVSQGQLELREEVVRAAARCVALAPGLGGGGKQGAAHKAAWRSQQLTFITLLHSNLNLLYQHLDCVTEVEVTVPDGVIKLEPVTATNALHCAQQLAAQFSSLSHFLRAMLLEDFPVSKSVSPAAILDVIVHAQKPTHSALGSSREALAVLSVLPSVLVAATRLLEALILCLGRNLVPRASLVCHLCSQVLVWTQQQHPDWPYAMDKPYSEARLAVYDCLQSWLSVAGASSLVQSVPDNVLLSVLADIHAEKPTVKLKVGPKVKKAKRKQPQTSQTLVSLEDRSEKLGDSVANRNLCKGALQTLALVLRTAAPILKLETVTNITSTAMKLVAELPVPYSDSECQSALYQLVLALCLEPHPAASPPFAAALATFTAGAHHPNAKVRTTCLSALSSLEKIIHPSAPSWYFALPKETKEPQSWVTLEDSDHAAEEDTPAKRRKIEVKDNSSSTTPIVLDDSCDGSTAEITADQTHDLEVSNDSVEVVFKRMVENSDKSKSLCTESVKNVSSNGNENEVVVIEEFKKNEVLLLAKEFTASLDETIKSDDKEDLRPKNYDKSEPLEAKRENEKKEIEVGNILSKTDNTLNEISSTSVQMDSDDIDVAVSEMLMDFKDEISVHNER